jgi:hypothetical protein
VLDYAGLAIATLLAVVGVGGVAIDEVRATRAEGRGFSTDIAWTLIWVVGLSALFVAA